MKTTVFPNFKVIKNNLHKLGKMSGYFACYCQYLSRHDKYKEGVSTKRLQTRTIYGALMDTGSYEMVAISLKPGIETLLEMMGASEHKFSRFLHSTLKIPHPLVHILNKIAI